MISKVWIVDGCISCNLCEDLCPEVFEVPAGDTSRTVNGHEKRLNGNTDLEAKIREARDSCPVEVIQTQES